jgi:hypothetical protein
MVLIDVDRLMIFAYAMNRGAGPAHGRWPSGCYDIVKRQATCPAGFSVIQPPMRVGSPTPDAGGKKFSLRLVAPSQYGGIHRNDECTPFLVSILASCGRVPAARPQAVEPIALRQRFGDTAVKFEYASRLLPLLREIEGYLIANTPAVIANLKVTDPAYAVFLWYDDSSTLPAHICPSLAVATTSLRKACADEFEGDEESFTDCLWRPNQVMEDELVYGRFADPSLANKCQEAYRLMWAANTTGKPLPAREDAELLRLFRSTMHRVATRLNDFDWGKTLPTTDDFVVAAVDRIGYWLIEDMASSIPPTKRKVLRNRGLLPGRIE